MTPDFLDTLNLGGPEHTSLLGTVTACMLSFRSCSVLIFSVLGVARHVAKAICSADKSHRSKFAAEVSNADSELIKYMMWDVSSALCT